MWILLVGVVLLYALQLDTRWAIGRDSALYLGLGENIAAGKGMTFNGQSQVGFSPGLPLMWAGIVSAVERCFLTGRAISILMALATIAMGWRLVKPLRDRWLALLATVLVAGNPRIWGQAGHLLTDLPFTCFLTMSLLCLLLALRRSPAAALLAGLAMGLAILFRLVGVVLLPLLVLGVLFDRAQQVHFRRRVAVAGLFLLVVTPVAFGWLGFYSLHRPQGDRGYVGAAGSRLSAEALGDLPAKTAGNAAELPRFLFDLFMDQRPGLYLGLPFLTVLLVGMSVSVRRREWLLLIPVWGYLLFLCAWDETAVYSRYLMPMAIPLALWLAEGVLTIARWIAGKLRTGNRRAALRAALIAVLLIAATGIVPNVYRSMEYRFRDVPWQVFRKHEMQLLELTRRAPELLPDDARVVTRESTIFHYATGRLTRYPSEGTDEGREELRGQAEEQMRWADWVIVMAPSRSRAEDPRETMLRELLAEHPDRYELMQKTDGWWIYREKQANHRLLRN